MYVTTCSWDLNPYISKSHVKTNWTSVKTFISKLFIYYRVYCPILVNIMTSSILYCRSLLKFMCASPIYTLVYN